MSQVPTASTMSVTKINNVDDLRKDENDLDLQLRKIIITHDIEKVRY